MRRDARKTAAPSKPPCLRCSPHFNFEKKKKNKKEFGILQTGGLGAPWISINPARRYADTTVIDRQIAVWIYRFPNSPFFRFSTRAVMNKYILDLNGLQASNSSWSEVGKKDGEAVWSYFQQIPLPHVFPSNRSRTAVHPLVRVLQPK